YPMKAFGNIDVIIISKILAIIGSRTILPFFHSLGIPEEMSRVPAPLQQRAASCLRELLDLKAGVISVEDTSKGLFCDFLTALSASYSSNAVEEFEKWLRRHGVEHNYHTCLSLWYNLLCVYQGVFDRRDAIEIQKL